MPQVKQIYWRKLQPKLSRGEIHLLLLQNGTELVTAYASLKLF